MTAPLTAPISKRKQYTVFAGLMIGILLAMLDNMIVGTASRRSSGT
ncbi:hypothetical protein [Kibdelosporangium philippinense]